MRFPVEVGYPTPSHLERQLVRTEWRDLLSRIDWKSYIIIVFQKCNGSVLVLKFGPRPDGMTAISQACCTPSTGSKRPVPLTGCMQPPPSQLASNGHPIHLYHSQPPPPALQDQFIFYSPRLQSRMIQSPASETTSPFPRPNPSS